MAASTQPTATVIAIYIYPIKACKGISVESGAICATGLKWDRQWMVVNSKGRMLTQRVEPRLSLVEVFLPREALCGEWNSIPHDLALTLNAPGMERLQIPLRRRNDPRRIDNVSIWEWSGAALDEGRDAAEWFSSYLGKPSRLVRFDTDNSTRPTDSNYASGYKTSFTDGFPFLLISQASLDTLNERLMHHLSINRFRPNILVEGCEAFAEDLWKTFTISGLTFHGVKLCSRCKVTTVDQETGSMGIEPLEMLQSFRSGQIFAFPKEAKRKVFFGQNLVCEQSLAPMRGKKPMIHVGDELKVLVQFSSINKTGF